MKNVGFVLGVLFAFVAATGLVICAAFAQDPIEEAAVARMRSATAQQAEKAAMQALIDAALRERPTAFCAAVAEGICADPEVGTAAQRVTHIRAFLAFVSAHDGTRPTAVADFAALHKAIKQAMRAAARMMIQEKASALAKAAVDTSGTLATIPVGE